VARLQVLADARHIAIHRTEYVRAMR
jgi:hypothetical protein